eukprot:scaffold213994_cov18-Tisochrysis_lutea.AAC.1
MAITPWQQAHHMAFPLLEIPQAVLPCSPPKTKKNSGALLDANTHTSVHDSDRSHAARHTSKCRGRCGIGRVPL